MLNKFRATCLNQPVGDDDNVRTTMKGGTSTARAQHTPTLLVLVRAHATDDKTARLNRVDRRVNPFTRRSVLCKKKTVTLNPTLVTPKKKQKTKRE